MCGLSVWNVSAADMFSDILAPCHEFFPSLLQGTETRMNNVFNDFLMLANIQFVENVSEREVVCVVLSCCASLRDTTYIYIWYS